MLLPPLPIHLSIYYDACSCQLPHGRNLLASVHTHCAELWIKQVLIKWVLQHFTSDLHSHEPQTH